MIITWSQSAVHFELGSVGICMLVYKILTNKIRALKNTMKHHDHMTSHDYHKPRPPLHTGTGLTAHGEGSSAEL